MNKTLKKKLFRKAVKLAFSARPSPNPRVGAIVVKNGRVVAAGYHRRAGEDHAEIAALKAAGSHAQGSDLIVTLEPCHTRGRTPPCTEAIIKAKIKKVFVGTLDPNPSENGRGVETLKKAGVSVVVEEGAIGEMCGELIEEWAKFITTSVPFVRIKAAVSVDGRIAAASGDSKWISSAGSRREAHRLRARHDAVMVGLYTITRDDPLLTVRNIPWKGDPPWRIVADTHLRTRLTSRIVQTAEEFPTFIAYGIGENKALKSHGVQTIKCKISDGWIDIKDLFKKLGALSITSVLVEGGGRIITSLIEKRLADAVTLFICPIIIGGKNAVPLVAGEGVDKVSDALRLKNVKYAKRGDEIILTGKLK